MGKDPLIPASYQTVIPYLVINNAGRFISFTEKVFGAKSIYTRMRDGNSIMHAELTLGESTIMLADATEKLRPKPAILFIHVANADDTFKKAIEAGAKVFTELSDQPYGRSGGLEDPFGNSWWVTTVRLE